jgi:hypothetical protein
VPGVCQTHAVLRVKSGTARPAMSRDPDHPSRGSQTLGRSIEIKHARIATY